MGNKRTDSASTTTRQKRKRTGRSRRWTKGLMVGVLTGLIGVVLGLTPLGNDFEKNVGLAWLFNVRGAIAPPPEVAVVAINERAASQLGLPPLPRDWPRSIHGRLIEQLIARGAALIVFDVDFRRPKAPEHDLAFARAVARSKRVVLVETLTGRRQPVFDASGRQTGTIWSEQLLSPMPALTEAARGLAPFPVPKVQVNIFQFWVFKPSVDDAPTLPVVALQLFLLDRSAAWRAALDEAGITAGVSARDGGTPERAAELRQLMRTLRRRYKQAPALGDRVEVALIAEHAQGLPEASYRAATALNALYRGADHRYLNFYGPPGTIPTIPYNAVITGHDPNVDPAALDFTGKVVFVGFSDLFDPGQPDRFYTVFTRSDGVDLSGVEIAATAFGNLLTNRSVTPSDTVMSNAILFVFGFGLGTGIYLLTALIAVPLALVLAVAYAAGAQFAFNAADIWLPLATPVLVQFPLALFTGLLAQYLLERRREKRFRKAVSYYLPDHIARELTDKEIDPSALNKVVYGICFATDMSGFTSISQSMDPRQLAGFMNSYFDALAEALKRHHVDVTEFHADTIMCAWTAPSAEALVRHHAPLAALAVLQAVDEFNARTGGRNLYARIGMEEGEFYLGHTGGGGRLGYSILGDCANTAARLESLNKHLGTHVLASAAVVQGSQDLLLRPLGRFVLVGKTDPVSVVEVVGHHSEMDESMGPCCSQFAEALQLFEHGNWAASARAFEAILRDVPNDGPSRFYLARCKEYQSRSPVSADAAVIRMDAK